MANARNRSASSSQTRRNSMRHETAPRKSNSSTARDETKAGRGEKWKKSMDKGMEDRLLNEASPLLRPRASEDVERLPSLESVLSPDQDNSLWDADTQDDLPIETKSSWYLFLLTLSIGGLQIAWTVELGNGSPYLLGLGISKSFLAIIWIAGPLSGVLVQPYIGIKSDHCRSRFGKRRPFMIGGVIATSVSLMALAWTRELINGPLSLFGAGEDSSVTFASRIIFAIIMIYILDFSINVIQAGIRAFIVDNAPMHQQDSANAWAARCSGVGNIVGYLFGYVDLPRYFWFFGDTQFKVLCVIASLAMASTITVSCLAIQERDPRLQGLPDKYDDGMLALFKNLYHSIRNLPLQISRVCQVQFFAWIGWFPFLFYITTYVGEIYVSPFFIEHPNMTEEQIDETWQRATRVGTFALFMFAITTFSSSVLLPFVVARSHNTSIAKTPLTPATPNPLTATGYFGVNPSSTSNDLSSKTALRGKPFSNTLSSLLSRAPSLKMGWLTLRRAWLLSHLIFAFLMFLTFFVRTVAGATVLVAFIGVPWAMTNWAPFALIAAEISRRDGIRRGVIRAAEEDGIPQTTGEAEQAGIVLGIHNVAIAAPQVIATLVSSVIFKALQKPRGRPGDDSVAWVLRFGGIAAIGAAVLTRRVMEEKMS